MKRRLVTPRSSLCIITLFILAITATGLAVAADSTIVVDSTQVTVDFGGAQTIADLPGPDGLVTLPEAVIAADNTPGPNTIAFNIPLDDPGCSWNAFPGQCVIFTEGAAGFLTDDATTIDGRTQTAFAGDTNPNGPEIHLRTTSPYANSSGFVVKSNNNVIVGLGPFDLFRYAIDLQGNNNVVKGNILHGLSAGVQVTGANNVIGGTDADATNVIDSGVGVWIRGATAAGNVVQGNLFVGNYSYGVSIENGASGNTVGGPTAAERNVINSTGHTDSEYAPVGADIRLAGNNNLVEGNYLGVDATGTVAAGGLAWSGIELEGTSNTIRNNLISGHDLVVTRINDRPAGIRQIGGSGHVIQGNLIGSDATGTQPLPNQYGYKAEAWDYADVPQDTLIGGTEPGQANVIAYNTRDGVGIGGNRIRVSGNAIYANDELGINLAPAPKFESYPDSVTPNDPGDADTGPNDLLNFPVVNAVLDNSTSTTVQGTLDTPNPQTTAVEIFSNDAADASGFGEGQVFQATATPDASGNFVATLPGGLGGKFITATATDASGNTSEFSQAVVVGQTQPNDPPTAVASASPQSGTAPLAVQFSSAGSGDPDGTIVGYHWDFADGATSAEPNPSHVYDTAGTYQATLIVTDDGGATASDAVTVTVDPAPTDTVTIGKAQYDSRKRQLAVQAFGSNPAATLTVYVTATNQLIGTLDTNGNGRYQGKFGWPTNPQTITVHSNFGGSDTANVSSR